jgi:hypothetical protein
MAGTTGLEPATSAVTVIQMYRNLLNSWALMANQGTQRHSKTLGNTSISNFSTLTDTLAI